MELVDQIRRNFARSTNGRALKLDGFEEENSSWTIKINNSYAVGIEIDRDIKINERFTNVSYFTDWFEIGSKRKYLLLLASSDESLRHEFAGICAVFLELGTNNKKRETILKHPIDWWKSWKELLGNKSVEKTVHGVLGELITLFYLKNSPGLSSSIQVENWTGPSGASVDIRSEIKNYEVKSSLIKYNNIVTISGQFQIDPSSNLSLMFVRFEDTNSENASDEDVVSLDIMIQKLTDIGMREDKLNSAVSRMGFKENSLDRKKQFKLLELREYPVDDSFPFINVNTLNNVRNMEHILQVTYKIDLTGLHYNIIELNLI